MTLDPIEIQRQRIRVQLEAEKRAYRFGLAIGGVIGICLCVLWDAIPYVIAAIGYALNA